MRASFEIWLMADIFWGPVPRNHKKSEESYG
jgi:hypothetical protein